MALVIYGFKESPPVRASLLTIQALGLEVDFKLINTLTGDHLKPEYLELNPLHTVPTLRDGDFVIWDSHAINAYLVGKYAKDDSLYPKDLQKRAVIDQRMYFDVGVLFNRLRNAVFAIIRGAKSVDKANADDFVEDGEFVIWNSHAINTFLVDKYSKDDKLYSKDLEKRAVINQRLYFENGVLFPRFGILKLSITRHGAKTVRKDLAVSMIDAYNSLETLLERSTYVAGEQLTIADFSIVTTLTTANILVPIASNRFPKISEWLTKIQALPYYASANQVGLDQFATQIRSKLS